jgi:CRP/FNR family cyclic AMP-dependent transcriptional regulator
MAAHRATQTLEGIELLQELTPHERERVALRCSWRRPASGERIIVAGAESREVLFVIAGRLRVVHHALSGREVAYAHIPAGGHVGELGVLDGKPRSASVEAEGNCLLAVLPAAAFLELLDSRPEVARRLMADLAGTIRACNQKAVELGLIGAVQRVHRELLRHARPGSDGGAIVKPLPTQAELAAEAGTTRETVARVLGQLAKSGVAVRCGRQLLIRDPAVLEAAAAWHKD